MYCKNCGISMQDDQKFCAQCGQKVKRPEFPTSEPTCKNCGAEVMENQKFCPQCGEKIVKTPVFTCPNCGVRVTSDAKFCMDCGKMLPFWEAQAPAPAEEPKVQENVCQDCGKILDPNAKFCDDCGGRASWNDNAPSSKVGNTYVSGSALPNCGGIGATIKSSVSSSSLEGKLAKKHLILAAMFLLMIILWYIPSIQIELEGMFSYIIDEEVISMSVGNLYGHDFFEAIAPNKAEYEALQGLTVAEGVLLHVVPFGLLAIFSFLPIIKQTLTKKRRMVWQIIVGVRAFFTPIFMLGILNSAFASEDFDDVWVSFTFGGWLIMILAVAITVLSIMILLDNRKINFQNK